MAKKRHLISHTIYRIFLWCYALFSLYPLIWMGFNSLKNNQEIFETNPFGPPTAFRFENYIKALSQYNVPQYFINSIIVSVATVTFTIVLGMMFSYATSRMRWKGQNIAKIYVSMGMFIPIQALFIPIFLLISRMGIVNTHLSLILPYTAFNLAFSTLVFYGFFRSIPFELEEAACIDGAGIFRTFFKIIVPTIKPAIATLIIFIFLQSWNEFPLASILISDEGMKTLPLGLLFFQGSFSTEWGPMAATMVIASCPTVIIYILFSNQVEKAMTVGGAVKG
ncbi:carbohydrate ABC transporter permease [Vallitalea okinawensis]|uniref:carbohydrate ABC transporter permease n=1 Tax=Vallitalea okinawensis TaxID=2078660 RepID=UPI000CFD90DF|nr:carbohydrate ABC transporter permease [Vallitalea okinawensis]